MFKKALYKDSCIKFDSSTKIACCNRFYTVDGEFSNRNSSPLLTSLINLMKRLMFLMLCMQRSWWLWQAFGVIKDRSFKSSDIFVSCWPITTLELPYQSTTLLVYFLPIYFKLKSTDKCFVRINSYSASIWAKTNIDERDRWFDTIQLLQPNLYGTICLSYSIIRITMMMKMVMMEEVVVVEVEGEQEHRL